MQKRFLLKILGCWKTRHGNFTTNREFQKSFPGMNFIDGEVLLPELKIIKTPTWQEKRKEKRKAAQEIKHKVEIRKKETAVTRVFGTEISLAKRNKVRLLESFETIPECNERTYRNFQKIQEGKKRKKDHIGNNTNTWDKQGCLAMVQAYGMCDAINFSSLARTFGVKDGDGNVPKNGGQIVKQYLEDNAIELGNFNYRGKNDGVKCRRKKRKIGGTEVSIPSDITNAEVQKQLINKINEGVYSIGKRIVQQKFEKLVLKNGFTIEKVEIEVEGRKVPLWEIREKHLQIYKKYYRLFTSEELKCISRNDLIKELKKINEFHAENISENDNTLSEKLKKMIS